jgi:O-acetyl-ADP-ribose deacetylase (regulator of RNase III)
MIDVRILNVADYEGEALARPVTASMAPPTDLMQRLDEAAGPALSRELQLQEPMAVGSAVVTNAGSLRVGLLVHAVVQEDGAPPTRKGLERATLSTLHRADAWEIEHIAMPPFGLGQDNFDIETSADIMLEVISTFMETGRRPYAVTILAENAEEADVFVARIMRPAT